LTIVDKPLIEGKIEHLGASATLNTSGDKYIYLAFSA